ncbi:MAG: HlyD family efflux transporter periplasmic adaptor subunit [Bacteroidales bacterium]|jgi:HlyD family secretion protein|nr:RND transporter [Lentimicrobiaceae bacterium]MDG1135423.1 HlyD family efflux transporter periplasmic adaptor subunit [Bacteroidales bacterium]MDG1901619.1 HlyD family efflux transporter periplasmic adaptor subunit [Bacteroidales bacterium]MDG2081668.1 HlyD family efflux transporter periplasmic adaptor subunit [Bacteroidales bacterium]|tara:strand:+ start:4178 stop:5539 length:1362 start_codon:yes stop_codon:yes gene_type:complete
MNRKNIIVLTVSFLLVVCFIWYFSSDSTDSSGVIIVEVEEGEFIIDVTTTGELGARSSEEIKGPNPNGLRSSKIHRYTIEDIVPDGTVVDSGQWVATLDRSDLQNKITDQELEVEKLETQYVKTQLDTTLTLRAARDELINLKFTLEEKKIIVDQSIYEPPATQRQVKIDFEKTQRSLKQNIENYEIKKQKAQAEMREVAANLEKAKRVLKEFNKLKNEFIVMAPKSGMVNYKRDWNGKKVGVGGQVSMWDNVVATLPNLSAMNSKTYVNEIDISKVKRGQKAIIEVDAFPNKSFTGVVFEVANMGEQMSNSNAKVFEVMIQVDGYDSVIRPSMTTKNKIITSTIDSVIFLPIECVNVSDSINFVYTRTGRKQVMPGEINETSIIINAGLEAGDKVYLIPPEGADEWSLYMLDQEIIEKFKLLDKKIQKESEPSNTKRSNKKGKRNFNGKRKK